MDIKQKQVDHAKEVLDAIGHESEKQGIKWTKYFMDKWDKQEWEKQQIVQDKLAKGTKYRKSEYYRLVANVLREIVYGIERPNWGWWAEVKSTDDGVIVILKHRTGRSWSRAFKPTGIPKIDYQAAVTYAAYTEYTMHEDEENPSPKTASGIYIAK